MKNKKAATDRKDWLGISPWLILGAFMILSPIFLFITADSIRKQGEHTTLIFMEKGEALIRTFEAGVRTGAMGKQPVFFQLQKLLIETAQQSDIDYIVITDDKGVIQADSDPSMIGEYYGRELDLENISRSMKVGWRRVPNPDDIDTFEVFRSFSTVSPNIREMPGIKPQGDAAQTEGAEASLSRRIIFIGLDMGPIEAIKKAAIRHTIFMAALLLFIGFSGIVTLFLAQGYRSTKRSLSRVRALSDNIMENMPIGLIALNGNGKIISLNQKAEAIFPYLSQEKVGEQADAGLPLCFRDLLDALATGMNTVEKEIDCPVAEDKSIPLEAIATVLKEENGSFLGYVILFRDLTEVHRLKNEIARSQRMASLGNLAAGMAHEIRNPLSSIKGFATYFKERYRDNPQDKETADIMVQEVERLNRVISQLLEFARPIAMEKRPTSLLKLIRNSLKIIESQSHEKNITIHTDLAPDVPDAMIDEDKIKQVLLNLYLNAMGAMKEGGSIKVRLFRGAGDTVNITVSDTGPGIDEKDLAHIFDPYFTTKPSGTGLGLSIVHKIIEAHDGEIIVKSAPGNGTAVSIVLPVI
jgi:two-component system, NtrC family, sensor histidine kinase HydH